MPSSASSLRAAGPAAGATAAAAEAGGIDLDALFRAHAPMVASIGFRILGRSNEVEDLVQDVFMDACRDRERIRNPATVKNWLAVCTVRRSWRRLRTRRLRRMLGLDQNADYEDVADPAASPARRLLLARVYEALDRMPVDQRLPWTLRHIEGEELESVARLCGISLATVKRRIAAAARFLTEQLG